MIRVDRAPLTQKTSNYLADKTTEILAEHGMEARRKRATTVWNAFRSTAARREVVGTLEAMATGRARCMYCEDSSGVAIDHFAPRCDYPERTMSWDNHLWACTHCNSNAKRDQFPTDDQDRPMLINPCIDDPLAHLDLGPSGVFTHRTPKGETSILVFGLNGREMLWKGRRDEWISAQVLMQKYASHLTRHESDEADKLLDVIRHKPFAGVRTWIGIAFAGPNAESLLDAKTIAAINSCPELIA